MRPALCLLLVACGRAASSPAAPDDVPAAAAAHREGRADAPVHVVYFTDYACEDCATFSLAAAEPLRTGWVARGRARLTIVDLPWHRGSVAGSAAAACAAEQGQYWAMHDLLFERQMVWRSVVDIPARLQSYAVRQLGLDSAAFARCAGEERHRRRADAAEDAARRFAVRGTPAFLIGGKLYYGSQQWSVVERLLLDAERGDTAGTGAPKD